MDIYDIAGIGVGPFNLSLASLLDPLKNINSIFLEEKPEFSWHPGMMIDWATIQNSFIKDLVSFTDPTSKHSFISFLHHENRLYEYINANFKRTTRREFNQYLKWVSKNIEAIRWGQKACAISPHEIGFKIDTPEKSIFAKNLVIGMGPTSKIPGQFQSLVGDRVFHSSQYAYRKNALGGERVTIIGGGQSGAEIFLDLVRSGHAPQRIDWISSRDCLLQLDESNFVNEAYTPSYVQHFLTLSDEVKSRATQSQLYSSDGITPETLDDIYKALYEVKYMSQKLDYSVKTSSRVVGIRNALAGYKLSVHNIQQDASTIIESDYIVLATGYQQRSHDPLLADIYEWVDLDDNRPVINDDYSLAYKGKGKIYALNMAKHSHGINDPNLSLNSWRAGVIINSVVGHEVYRTPQVGSILESRHAHV